MDDSCEMAARVFRGKDYSIHAQTAEEADQIIIFSNCFISKLLSDQTTPQKAYMGKKLYNILP